MPFNQDDQRERAMVGALNLSTRPNRARHEEDAFLEVEVGGRAHRLLFECKSSPENGDFGTGRDTSLAKLNQWTDYHFVFGWFIARDNVPIRMWYGSPRMMRNWLDGEKEYLQADLTLSGLVPAMVDDQVVTALFGDGTEFTYEQMNKVMKDQWKAKKSEGRQNRYVQYADVQRARRVRDNLYSRDAALKAVRERTEYLLRRGSTVNNRKISHGYVMANCVELRNTAWVRSLEAAVNAEMELEPLGNPADV